MKKKLFAAGIIVICLALCAGSTWAYFTAEDYAHNVITSGTIGISIIEEPGSGDGVEVELPSDGLSNIMPGSRISQIVSVANTGEADAWIRVRVDVGLVSSEKTPLPSEIEVQGVPVPVLSFSVGQEWIDGGDGYYYYAYSVAPGANTAAFFDQMTFALEMGNAYQGSTANVTIVAQAVQVANNSFPDGGNVTDINWPET